MIVSVGIVCISLKCLHKITKLKLQFHANRFLPLSLENGERERERERERAKYYKNLCFNSIEAVAGREKCIKTLIITLNESGEGVGVL